MTTTPMELTTSWAVLDYHSQLAENYPGRKGAGAGSHRALQLHLDPSLELIYLSETRFSGQQECLSSITKPGVRSVRLRQALLTWQPGPGGRLNSTVPTLAHLEAGNCFLTANSRKIQIASFRNEHAHPALIVMNLLDRPNLLEYLRAEEFVLEISGLNRRALAYPLRFSVRLEFEVCRQQPAEA